MATAVETAIYRLGLNDQEYANAAARVDAANKKLADGFSRVEARADPAEAAARKLAAGILAVERAREAGEGTAARQDAALARLTQNYDRQIALLNRTGGAFRGAGMSIQQAGFQIGDFAVQIASGTNPLRAFIQQGTQLISMFGPWGAVIGAAGAVVGALAMSFFDLGDATDGAAEKAKAFEKQYGDISDLMDEIDGKVRRSIDSLRAHRQFLIETAQAEIDRINTDVAAIPEFVQGGKAGGIRNTEFDAARKQAAQDRANQLALLGQLGVFGDGRAKMGQSYQDLIDELNAADKKRQEEAERTTEAEARLAQQRAQAIMRVNDAWARSTEQSAQAAQSLVDKLDPVAAATRALERDQAMLLVAMAKGIEIAGGYSVAMDRLTESYQEQIDPIGALIKKMEEAQALEMSAASKDLLSNLKMSGDVLENFFDQSFDRIGAGITEAFATGQIEMAKFGDIGRAVLSELMQLAIQLAVINPIKNWATGGNDATMGTVFQGLQFLFNKWSIGSSVDAMMLANPGIFHTGGIVGASRVQTRAVPMAAFADAPRFHNGGGFFGPGERPAILKDGEGVFTREQMGAMGGQSLQIGTININATGGSREQNADVAQQISMSLRQELRAFVKGEIRESRRPNNPLNPLSN